MEARVSDESSTLLHQQAADRRERKAGQEGGQVNK